MTSPEDKDPTLWMDRETYIKNVSDAISAVHYHYTRWAEATNEISRAGQLVNLNDAIIDLVSYHPGWDYESGVIMPWKRENE